MVRKSIKLYVLSESAIKVKAAQKLVDFLNTSPLEEQRRYELESVGNIEGLVDGGVVAQPLNDGTLKASSSRISQFKERFSEDSPLEEGSIIVSFENGIYFNLKTKSDCSDVCVMVIEEGGISTHYRSFGISIDSSLFKEYGLQESIDFEQVASSGADKTFGKFVASKFREVPHNNWMGDVRFGNVDREDQIRSCVDQYLLDRFARKIEDYPRDGVMFKDITPVMADQNLLQILNSQLKRLIEYNYPIKSIDFIAGLDSRGFYFAPVIAQIFGKGFIPIRKAAKVPAPESDRSDPNKFITESYSTEYSDDEFGLIPSPAYVGKSVLIIDDLLATGGSVSAAINVLTNAKLSVVGAVTIYDVKGLRTTAYEKFGKNVENINVTAKINYLVKAGKRGFSDNFIKYTNPFFKVMSLVRPDIDADSLEEYRSFKSDTKPLSYPITDIMIERIRGPDHLNVEELDATPLSRNLSSDNLSDDSEPPHATMPKLSRRFTLSTKEWIGNAHTPDKMKNVKVLYTDKDADLAENMIRVLVADVDLGPLIDPVKTYGVKVTAGLFSNGESHAFIHENIRNCHVIIVSRIRTTHINNDLMELYLIMDACNRSGVSAKTIVLPYYAYARSDKKDAPRTHIGAAVQAMFLDKLDIDNLISVDLHAGQIQGLISRGFHNLYIQNYLCEYIYTNYLRFYRESEWNDKFVLIAPDAGSTKAIKAYSKILKIDNIALDKTRNYKASEEGGSAVDKVRFIGDKEDFHGKVGLIIDDIGDTMGTMSAAVKTLVENGLDSAIIFVTHGVLSGPAIERINKNPYIKEMVVSDSLPQDNNVAICPKLRVVSISELLGRTVDGVLTGRSISRLFKI